MTDSDFHDVSFPPGISFGATGGPEWRNEIVELVSGHEKRNARWANSRRHFDAGTGVRSLADLRQVLDFFEARRGSLHAFRFRDPFDHSSAPAVQDPAALNQILGVGDGATSSFQLVKNYGSYQRIITKPVAESVVVAVGGAVLHGDEDFTLDATRGRISFHNAAIPVMGALVTAGFLFDVPVRFATEKLIASIAAFQAGEIPSIPLIEVRV